MSELRRKHKEIMEVVKEEDLKRLNKEREGIKGVAAALGSNISRGMPNDEKEIAQRRKELGSNAYSNPRSPGFFRSIFRSLKEFVVAVDAVNLMASTVLFVATSVLGICRFSRKKSIKEDRVEVLRGGRRVKVPMSKIVVGDVVCLKIGDTIPADGLFAKGKNLQVDRGDDSAVVEVSESHPFLFFGSQVVNGYGCQMLVTSVGNNRKLCEMTRRRSGDDDLEIVTVQERVYGLTSSMRYKLGLPIALLGFVVLTVRFFTGSTKDYRGIREFVDGDLKVNLWSSSLIEFFAAAFTTVVLVIPESLRLGVSLIISYSKKKMMADMDMIMVSDLTGCETLGSVTTICTCEAAILTASNDDITVQQFWLCDDSSVFEKQTYTSNVSRGVKQLFQEGITVNATTTPTDRAILSWAVHELDMDIDVYMDMEDGRCRSEILDVEAYSWQKKRSGILLERRDDCTVHVHWRGAAEVILHMCSSYYDSLGIKRNFNHSKKVEILALIQGMIVRSLKCIAFAHKSIGVQNGCHQKLKELDGHDDQLVLLALVGVRDVGSAKMKEAVKDCKAAGVDVKLIISDDISMVEYTARECGILVDSDDTDKIIRGEVFRSYSQNDRMARVDKIRVMVNSSPNDKVLMLKALKKNGEIVAMCGSSAKDASTLLEADVGISTRIGDNIPNMVILDGNFATVAKVLKSSMCMYNNIQKFMQFQLTLNIAALAVVCVSAIFAGEITLYSSFVLWLNLIVNTLASLALATEPTKEPIKRQPVGRKEPLISNIMLRNLLGQVLYQIVVVLILLVKDKFFMMVDEDSDVNEDFINERNSLIFHAFMLCQVFNEFNARNLEKKNVFKGIHKDILFLIVIVMTISVQVIFLQFFLGSGAYLDVYLTRLKLSQWGVCFGFAITSWPISWFFKCLPVPKKPVLNYLSCGKTPSDEDRLDGLNMIIEALED